MSAAELTTWEVGRDAQSPRAVLGGRLIASEILMVLRRRRNQLILLVLIAIPIIIGVAVKLTTDPGRNANDGLLGGITNNGIFVAFMAIVVVIPFFLPLAVSIVAGETVAGEANTGTLRYLLAVPVGRTRLLLTKFIALAFWCLTITIAVALAGVAIGFALFPAGDVTLLSGTQTSLTGGIGRLAVVVGYASLMMLAMAAIGLFISTLTEVPVAAMAATLVFAIIMQVLDAVPQLRSIHSWLLSDYLLKFDPALRDPFRIGDMATGMWVASAYVAIFWLLAWARFTTKDVSS